MGLPPFKMWTEPFPKPSYFWFYAQLSFTPPFATFSWRAVFFLLQHPCEHSCDWKTIVAGAKAGYFNAPQKNRTHGRLWTLLKQDSNSQPKLACESACAFIRLRATRVKRLLRDSCSGAKALRLPTRRFTCRRHLHWFSQMPAVCCSKLWPILASILGRELPDNNPCPSRPWSQNECQLQDQPTLGSKLPTWGDFVEVPSLSPLRIKRIGRPRGSASTCRIAAIQERLQHVSLVCGFPVQAIQSQVEP